MYNSQLQTVLVVTFTSNSLKNSYIRVEQTLFFFFLHFIFHTELVVIGPSSPSYSEYFILHLTYKVITNLITRMRVYEKTTFK